MIDPDFDPIIPPMYYDGYLASKDRKYDTTVGKYIDTGTWTVYTYPNIVIWEFDNQQDAERCAEELNAALINR
jgi:hypothetical protein